ncbi:hypothetical protein BK408_13025 [Escherichia coli]|nr:hypothetical protein BK258_18970 [Escherichia coli]OJL39356.1 hypothetical protein BK259_00885 [Escherichia coli]OJL52532.1 hypothetical protein BK261_18980 [Escherichia coli]OJL90589.1 hypothetical protein BK272_23170 [Escherichia coli]OJS77220.1 hypothetical protein BK408_13025 [Escherichia coli]
MPDALRLSGLPINFNILNLHDFVGRIRRSRRIQHEQRARCQQSDWYHFCHYHSSRSLRWYSTPSSSLPCQMPKALALAVCD